MVKRFCRWYLGKVIAIVIMLMFLSSCSIWTTTIDDGVHKPIKIVAGYNSYVTYEDPRTGIKVVDDRRGRPSTLEQIFGAITLGVSRIPATVQKGD